MTLLPNNIFSKNDFSFFSNVFNSFGAAPTFTLIQGEVDTATEFRAWMDVKITRDTSGNCGGYVVKYKRF